MAKKKSKQPTTPREHIQELIRWMSQGVFEKEQVIAAALLTSVAGENIFLLGPPGTAKSLVASRLKGVFKDGRSFDYLMSRFSTPDEIFGPVSISRLKNDDRYERLTEGYLPDAHVVFLDEIWKAGPSIQNTLLTVINEHIFHNGGRAQSTPMKVLIAASNELPAKDEGLEALWDRFLVRMVSNCIANDASFFKMITTDSSAIEPLAEEYLITDSVYERWQQESKKVALTAPVEEAIKALRKTLADKEKEDGNSLRYYISDRRWRKAFRLMQTSAYLNGRSEIDLSDYLFLTHCFWNDVESIPTVIEAFADSLGADTIKVLDKIEKSIRKLMNPQGGEQWAQRHSAAESEFVEYDYFYYRLENTPKGETYFTKLDYPSLSTVAKEGIRYYDAVLGKYIIRVLTPGSIIDTAAINATEVDTVRLERLSGGVIVDGTPYKFTVAASRDSDDPTKPFYYRAADIVKQFDECVEKWESQMSSSGIARNNMFLSGADLKIVDKMRKSINERIKTLEIKVNNVKAMAF